MVQKKITRDPSRSRLGFFCVASRSEAIGDGIDNDLQKGEPAMSQPTTATEASTEPSQSDASRTIRIFDTTLRDGEQSPGASMNLAEKLEVAQLLAEMGVDIIEAGFPIASPGDFEAVKQIAQTVRGSTICGLARCSDKDIDRAWEAIKHAPSSRIMCSWRPVRSTANSN